MVATAINGVFQGCLIRVLQVSGSMLTKSKHTVRPEQTLIIYIRTSTKEQFKDGVASQISSIKKTYPDLRITDDNVLVVKEVMSGFAKPEKRFANGVGKVIRLLKHHPHAILIVSTADRISRIAEVFELIVTQGLGHRILVADTGQTVAEVVASGLHYRIEETSKRQKEKQQDGRKRYLASGRFLGNPQIATQSHKATQALLQKSERIKESVLSVLKEMIWQSRGLVPTHKELALELDRREMRTGHGLMFTVKRIEQLKKNNKSAWTKIELSYRIFWDRIRGILRNATLPTRRRRRIRRNLRRMKRLHNISGLHTGRLTQETAGLRNYARHLSHLAQRKSSLPFGYQSRQSFTLHTEV